MKDKINLFIIWESISCRESVNSITFNETIKNFRVRYLIFLHETSHECLISTIYIRLVRKFNQFNAINLLSKPSSPPPKRLKLSPKTTLSLSLPPSFHPLSPRNNRRIIHNAGRIYGGPIVSQLIQALCHLTPPLPSRGYTMDPDNPGGVGPRYSS